MDFIKIPTKGMRDFLPKEMELREYVLKVMKETYKTFGFELISTPAVEHIENLTNKQGGDNEKLIFKVLKRGEKLDLDNAKDINDLVDSGLRYDLTVPLTRFYAGNMNELESPFRAFQTGNVWRADRPQKGRYREFTQCDLDIFGEKTNLAEIELITAIITFLKKLDFTDFVIKINDRRILKAMSLDAGFTGDEVNRALISLDKLDKIGIDGVREELIKNGFSEDVVSKYLNFFVNNLEIEDFCKQFNMDEDVVSNLKEIMDITSKLTNAKVEFSKTLVRGMGYYTGPIFEITVDNLEYSIGGGGRYDEMVSKYGNINVPACGFSIGFERLILLLQEREFTVPDKKEKIALVINERNICVFEKAQQLREDGKIVKVVNRNKNFKFQKEQLGNNGYKIEEL